MILSSNDLRLAVRHLRRAPVYTASVVFSLALGIGATVTMFSIVEAVLLRPLPYLDSDRLVVVQRSGAANGAELSPLSAAEVAALREARRTIKALGAYSYSEFVVSGDAQAERVIGAQATADLLHILGVRLPAGRTFQAGEDGPTPAQVVVLSHGFWARRFGADASIVGRSIRLDGKPYIVIGILPEAFEFPRGGMAGRSVDLLTPLSFDPTSMQGRNRRSLTGVARLGPGATVDNAQTELALAAGSGSGGRIVATPIAEHVVGKVRSALVALFASVVLLLAIVSANTTSLMLSRGAGRRRAVSVRLALGAQRLDIVRPAIVEALLLAVAGGLIGLFASIAARGLLQQLMPASLPRQAGIRVDATLLIFATLVSLLVGAACSVLPALRMAGENALGALVESGRASVGKRGRSVQRFLVAGQIAIGTVLLAGTGATLVGYARLHRIAPGFEPAAAVTMSVSTSGMRYRDPAARIALVSALLSRTRALPGVQAAATTNILPLGGGIMSAGYQIVGVTDSDSTALRTAPVRSVSGGFFSTLGIPLVRGRAIDDTDDASQARVAVVNEAFARALAGTDPLAARIRISSPMVDSGTIAIVGVAANTKERGLAGSAEPMIYLSMRQSPFPYNNFVVRTAGAAAPIAAALRSELGTLDADLAIDEVARLSDRVSSVYALQSFSLTTLAGFALLAICLVGFGVFALVSGHVALQTKAIGIRMALGATPWQVHRAILADTIKLATLGVAIGAVVSVGLRDAIAWATRDASALGGGVVIGAAAMLGGVVLVAGWLPARRASRTDPRTALATY